MRKVIIVILIVGLFSIAGLWMYNWLKTDQVTDVVSIEKDNAKSLDVDIRFGVGNLLIEGGASGWVNGDIDTEVKKWYPSVTYKNKKDVGHFEIQQKKKKFWDFGKKGNNWNLQLTNEIPVDLDVQMGASESELNLGGIRLSHLSVDGGVSDTIIDLGGDWKESFDAEIDLGVGDAVIHLPQGTGVKLSVSKGIGSIGTKGLISKGSGVYVNEAYDQTDININMEVNVGVGQVKFLLVE